MYSLAQNCQTKAPQHAMMQEMAVSAPFERLSIDVTGLHPRSSKGNIYISTMVDHFSKWAEVCAVCNHESVTVAGMLLNNWINRFGCMVELISDQGLEFEGILIDELSHLMEINKIRTSPFRPSTNSCVERFKRTLSSLIVKVLSDNQKYWDVLMPPLWLHIVRQYIQVRSLVPLELFSENKSAVHSILYGITVRRCTSSK